MVKGQQRDKDRHRKADAAEKPAPMMCFHPTSLGNCDTPNLTAKSAENNPQRLAKHQADQDAQTI